MEKIKETIKDVWKWTAKLYLAAFLATTVHIGSDFFIYNLPRIERGETIQDLRIRKYQINIDGKEKQLTLVGETHYYNKTENEIAKRLVSKHDHFAAESAKRRETSIGNFLYELAISIPCTPALYFYIFGSGRWYPNIEYIAEEQGHKIYALEKDPFCVMSFGEKMIFFGEGMLQMVLSPLAYYEGKYEEPYNADVHSQDIALLKSWIDKRDKVMAGTIADLLKRDEIDNLLAKVGNGHLEGVISNLSKQVELKEVK